MLAEVRPNERRRKIKTLGRGGKRAFYCIPTNWSEGGLIDSRAESEVQSALIVAPALLDVPRRFALDVDRRVSRTEMLRS